MKYSAKLGTALTVTALMLEAGYAVLPYEPSGEALAAGAAAAGITTAQALLAYRAMHQVGGNAASVRAQYLQHDGALSADGTPH